MEPISTPAKRTPSLRHFAAIVLLFHMAGLRASQALEPRLFWISNTMDAHSAIKCSAPDGTNQKVIIETRELIDVAIDPSANTVYWTAGIDGARQGIYRTVLDGSVTEAIVESGLPNRLAINVAAGKLYWTGSAGVLRANLDGSEVETIVANASGALGIALDTAAGKVYWSESGIIRRAGVDGTGAETLLDDGGAISDVALDLVNGKIYWANRTKDRIGRANLDGTSDETIAIASDFVSAPLDVALDAANGHFYWCQYGDSHVYRANLDGSNVTGISTGPGNPIGLEIDLADGKVYAANFATDAITRFNLDGASKEIVTITGLFNPFGIAVDPISRRIYWGQVNGIRRANFDGSGAEAITQSSGNLHIELQVNVTNGTLIWANRFGNSIYELDPETEHSRTVLDDLGPISGIAFDPQEQKVYWGTSPDDSIYRADLNGASVETIIPNLAERPVGLSFDVLERNLYWLQNTRVWQSNPDGTMTEDLFGGGSTLCLLGSSSELGKLYYSNCGSSLDRIRRANLDGSDVEVIAIENEILGFALFVPPSFPNDLDFDGDGDIDLSDFAQFSLCFAGPNVPPAANCPPGVDADFDNDGDVDLADFSTFALNFTGPQ